MLKAELLNEDQFINCENDWHDLLLNSSSSVFQSWAWCRHWWQINKNGKKLAVIALKNEDNLIGILPLYISRTYLGLPIKVGAFLGTGTFDYGGILINAGADYQAG